jgi:hypothetical protein
VHLLRAGLGTLVARSSPASQPSRHKYFL